MKLWSFRKLIDKWPETAKTPEIQVSGNIQALTATLCMICQFSIFQLSAPHHFHNVAIEAVIGGKGYDATEDAKDAQETETVNLCQHHPGLKLTGEDTRKPATYYPAKKHGLIGRRPGQTRYYLQTVQLDASMMQQQKCPLSYNLLIPSNTFTYLVSPSNFCLL